MVENYRPKIGVYVCHCGINIGSVVDVPAVVEYASKLPGVAVSREYTYMCSDPGQNLVKEDIANEKLNRVIVASCSPRMHEPTFRKTLKEAGLNPYLPGDGQHPRAVLLGARGQG